MEKKIKIAFLSRFQDKVFRGVESYVFELSKRLEIKFQVDIFSGNDADSLVKVLKGKYDFVIPTNGRWQSFIMGLGRIAGGYKTLIAGHAGVGRDDIWNLVGTFPNIFVALTDKELIWAKNLAWNSKIVKIPNGIDLDKFSPNGKKVDLNLEKPVILSVGALEWYKHHELSINAVAKLTRGSLLIIGKGSQKDELKKHGREMLGESRFKILEVSYEDISSYYRSCDLFILPSWDREAFGIVYLEALATNLAVIAPNDLSRREIIKDAGIFIDPFDTDQFVQAINKGLELNWGDKPRKQAEKFSWDKIASQYEKVLKES